MDGVGGARQAALRQHRLGRGEIRPAGVFELRRVPRITQFVADHAVPRLDQGFVQARRPVGDVVGDPEDDEDDRIGRIAVDRARQGHAGGKPCKGHEFPPPVDRVSADSVFDTGVFSGW